MHEYLVDFTLMFIFDLFQALNHSESCRNRTRFIVFLGTPHRGSDAATWASIASNLAQVCFRDSNQRVLDALRINSEVLESIHDQFKKTVSESNIKIHSFQEARGISGIKGLHGKVLVMILHCSY